MCQNSILTRGWSRDITGEYIMIKLRDLLTEVVADVVTEKTYRSGVLTMPPEFVYEICVSLHTIVQLK